MVAEGIVLSDNLAPTPPMLRTGVWWVDFKQRIKSKVAALSQFDSNSI
jgi:hypothetical protein